MTALCPRGSRSGAAVRSAVVVFLLASGLTAVGGTGLAAQSAPPAASPAEVAALEWIGLLREERFDSAAVLVEAELRRELDGPRLDTLWSQVVTGLGQVEQVTPAGTRSRGGMTTVDLRARFPGRVVLLQVLMSPRREILGFTLRPLRP